MAHETKQGEWRMILADGSSEILVFSETAAVCRLWQWVWVAVWGLASKLCRFLKKAWELGQKDPRKFMHCFKVGIALTAVSLLYYMKPLYDGVGGNAMWAVMTVVVVFENTAGATISKTINRVCGTSLAGFLGIGVHWVASQAGEHLEPVIVAVSLFLLASAATFSRFIPNIKARFDYGAMIFILTFSLVSVSGYRVDELLALAHQRISTIIIGTSLCIMVSTIICPIWAGQELYVLITANMDKLANSLDSCVAQYFSCAEAPVEETEKKLVGYKCVLSCKATEDSLANFARWEPAHGRFNFRHPWKQYLKIGASMRTCASCIDALIGCINHENKAADEIKKHITSIALKVGTNSVSVIGELANTMRTMTKSSRIDKLVAEMNSAAQQLQHALKSYPNLLISSCSTPPACHNHNGQQAANIPLNLMDVIQVVTVASLLIEIVGRVQGIVICVDELAGLAKYQSQPALCIISNPNTNSTDHKVEQKESNEQAAKTLQMV